MASAGRLGRALRRVPVLGRAAGTDAAEVGTPAGTPVAAAPAAARAPVKKAPAIKAPAKQAPAKQAPAKKAPAKKAPAKQAPAKQAPAKEAVAKKAPATKAPAKNAPVAPAGSEWTASELGEIRAQLATELAELQAAYEVAMRDFDALQRSGTDGAGDDQADAGSKTFDREQEQQIAANRFELITQIEHAVERIDSGTYGFCESCGKPIPKARLQAFPAATLDVACKQRAERR